MDGVGRDQRPSGNGVAGVVGDCLLAVANPSEQSTLHSEVVRHVVLHGEVCKQAPEYEGRKSVLSVTSGYDVSIRVRQTESVYAFNHPPSHVKSFQKNKGEVLRKIFDVEQFETRNRKFVDEIKTNGYGASVTMIRSVTTASVVVVEKQVSTKKRKKNDGTAGTEKKPRKKRQ
ncbi:hypothetical protein F442_07856 [Phytophthora nicotianae P10297]|uniref:Uncharacterized protein n=1 Tax=Phytophthora nicotianae P10297 TaxID=1317064 RepID=W2ZFP6_PHYNI|nr:hypothetical protein F442_07856 [Phytophthora nicotianae P10297]